MGGKDHRSKMTSSHSQKDLDGPRGNWKSFGGVSGVGEARRLSESRKA